MPAGFHLGSRELQDRFDTRALADRIDRLLVTDTIDEGDAAFIRERDMFFLASADAEGRPTCSYKGGEPGFVRVLDERTVAFPDDGNGMYLSMGNVLETERGPALPHLSGATGCAWRARPRSISRTR